MVIVIDNYDSFTYNLVQYLGELGAELRVFRNDAITVSEIAHLQPEGIVISPGPGRPEQAGISVELIRAQSRQTPILGVCLGHQAIGQAYGARIVSAPALLHGKSSQVQHDGVGILAGIESPFDAGRYHSLVIDGTTVPDELEVVGTASSDGTIMAVRHREFPVFGLQFHPESVLTADGKTILQNFLKYPRVAG